MPTGRLTFQTAARPSMTMTQTSGSDSNKNTSCGTHRLTCRQDFQKAVTLGHKGPTTVALALKMPMVGTA